MPVRSLGALAIAATLVGCTNTETVGSSNFLTGTYVATIFEVTPDGEAPINVLAAGGSLRITVDASGSTSGTLSIPGSVTGTGPFTASMAGSVTITAFTVEFDQAADSFVRDLIWSRTGTFLSVVSQPAGDATYTITLIRE